MGKDLLHSAMKVIAKENGVKLSAQNDLYKMQAPYFVNVFFCEYGWMITCLNCILFCWKAK